MSSPQRIVNIADLPLRDGGNGKGFQAKLGRAGPLLGLKKLGCSLTIVPPGKRAWPFHRHHVMDELFYIVSGSGEVRLDDRTLPVRAGDLIANPAGAEAHQLINTGTSELRYLALSDIETVDIIEYPDSGKVGMAAGVRGGDLSSASYKALGRVTPADYFDGEMGDS
ncbi:cupin domain-containing protein [Reyranella soli]|uniref:Cupin n=1 Tax=Reyranella soli TaxID=1230389 RepID=A0A512N2N7_9HYPH|nr:cupin domain-containing protein [Reyranella soli]GEP53255.1 cupin [Reyranella soli]